MKRLLAIIAFLHLYIFTFCASAQDRSIVPLADPIIRPTSPGKVAAGIEKPTPIPPKGRDYRWALQLAWLDL